MDARPSRWAAILSQEALKFVLVQEFSEIEVSTHSECFLLVFLGYVVDATFLLVAMAGSSIFLHKFWVYSRVSKERLLRLKAWFRLLSRISTLWRHLEALRHHRPLQLSELLETLFADFLSLFSYFLEWKYRTDRSVRKWPDRTCAKNILWYG